MDFLPKEPVFDDTLYSEQMHEALSDTAKLARSIQNPPRRKFERQVFLDAMAEAFEQIGGVRRLTLWADKNETEFFRLMKSTIPQAQLLDIQGKMQMQILPALPPSPLDGDYIDATPEPGRNPEALREPIHGEQGGSLQLSGPSSEGGGRIQHVPPKASGEKT
jgi:hypothetical protein